MKSLFSDLTDVQLEWQEKFDEYCTNEIGPYMDDIEQEKMDIWDVLRPMGKKGYIGVMYPKRFGGLGGDFMLDLLMSEAVCYQSLPVDMARFSSTYPAMLIRMFGKLKELRKYIDPLIR